MRPDHLAFRVTDRYPGGLDAATRQFTHELLARGITARVVMTWRDGDWTVVECEEDDMPQYVNPDNPNAGELIVTKVDPVTGIAVQVNPNVEPGFLMPKDAPKDAPKPAKDWDAFDDDEAAELNAAKPAKKTHKKADAVVKPVEKAGEKTESPAKPVHDTAAHLTSANESSVRSSRGVVTTQTPTHHHVDDTKRALTD